MVGFAPIRLGVLWRVNWEKVTFYEYFQITGFKIIRIWEFNGAEWHSVQRHSAEWHSEEKLLAEWYWGERQSKHYKLKSALRKMAFRRMAIWRMWFRRMTIGEMTIRKMTSCALAFNRMLFMKVRIGLSAEWHFHWMSFIAVNFNI